MVNHSSEEDWGWKIFQTWFKSYSNPSLLCYKEMKRPFCANRSLSLHLAHCFAILHLRGEGEQAPLCGTGNQQRICRHLDGTTLNVPHPISHLLTGFCSQSHTAMQIKSKAPWASEPIFSISDQIFWKESRRALLIGTYWMWEDGSVQFFWLKLNCLKGWIKWVFQCFQQVRIPLGCIWWRK